MIDINMYRQKIGNFQQPGQRKIVQKYEMKRKVSDIFSVRLLHLALLLVTFSSFWQSSSISEKYYQTPHDAGSLCFSQISSVSNSEKCSFQVQMNWSKENEIQRTLQAADSNFYACYKNGNRANRGIKLCHWNAGNSHLRNKVNSIESVVSRYSPHILGISEANLLKNHDLSEVQIEDYELITSLTMNNPQLQYSRVVVYKHSSIISKVREDLMSPKFSSVWLECGLPRKRRFLVCNLYREWQYMGQGGDKSSKDIKQ